MAFGLCGERVRLVPLEESRHLENCYRWINDWELTKNLLASPPMHWIAEKEWFERASKSSSDVMFAIELLDGTHIGNSGIHRIDFQHGHALTGSLIGAEEHRGRGYGTEANRLRSEHAFRVMGLRLLQSSYIGSNERSARMQELVGYLPCGVIPGKYWRNGRYQDEHLTYLTRERYERLVANRYTDFAE